MQKKRQSIPPLLGGMLKKFKWFLCLVCFFFFEMTGQVEGQTQEKKISLNLKNATMAEFVKEVKRQTGYTFFYNDKVSSEIEPITIQKENATLENVLQEVVGTKGFTFVIEDNTIVIKKVVTQPVRTVVKGKVMDCKNLPLPGVTVKLENVTVGTSTDMNGNFQLTLPVKEGVLEFSFVGFKSQKVKFLERNKDSLHVVLEENVQEMEEVVVTGYQALREKAMAGAYSRVKMDDLVMAGNETLEQMLQGVIPGVMVLNTSGLTGMRQKVRVRGTSTLLGNAEPVWVVDGIIQEDPLPFEISALTTMDMNDNMDMIKDFVGGAISWLNPSDIKDITVLKDASSTAIYGVKAANGVIVITTKRGERGDLSVSYSGNYSMSERLNYNKMELMNSKERVELSREAFLRGATVLDETIGYTGLALAFQRGEISLEEFSENAHKLEVMNTDWFDILYRTPFSHSHAISFGGGTDKLTTRASFGYQSDMNTAKGNEQIAYRGSLNMSVILWERLTLSASLSGSHTETKAFAAGVDPFNYAINTSRTIPCYDEKGNLYYYLLANGFKYNILNELANSGNENVQKILNTNVNVRLRLSDVWTISSTFGLGTSSTVGQSWFTEYSNRIASIRNYEYGTYTPTDLPFQNSQLPYGGELAVNENRNFNYTLRGQLEFVKVFGVHAVNAVAGVEARSTQYDGFSQTNYGYMRDRGNSFVDVPVQNSYGSALTTYSRTNPRITNRLSNYFSYYLTANYMYDNRYALNFSVRSDASNRFGQDADKRFQPVWSLGVRWNVTDESWMQEQNFVNHLNITGSYGYQANVVENVSPDLIAKIEPVDPVTGEFKMSILQSGNPDLKWEKTQSINLGVDFALFGSKLNGNFSYFHKKTSDLITLREVPSENGVVSMYVNGGDMQNSGWDLSFSLVPVRVKDFIWSLGFNTSKVYNEVRSNFESEDNWRNVVNGSYNKKGYPVSSFWAFRFKGLNPTNGGPMFDWSGANTNAAELDVTEYMVHAGKLDPDLTAGINMNFRYKQLALAMNLYLSTGNQAFLSSPYESSYVMPSEYRNASSQLVKRWRKPGDEKFTSIPSIPVGNNCYELHPFKQLSTGIFPYDAWAYSDVRVVDAWYLRCNSIVLSYRLPEKIVSRFAKDVNCSLTITNPFQIISSDFDGRDPEVAKGAQPLSRKVSFTLNMSF